MNTNIDVLNRMLNKKGLSLSLESMDGLTTFSPDAQAYEVNGITIIDDITCYFIEHYVAYDEIEAMNIITELLEEK